MKLLDNKGRGGTMDMLAGPRVPPGTYQVRLTANGRSTAQRFEVVKDPRVRATEADLREQFAWAKRAHDLVTRVHGAVLALRDVRAQAEAWASRVETPAIRTAAGALARALTAIEEELVQVRSEDPRIFPSKLNARIATVGLSSSTRTPHRPRPPRAHRGAAPRAEMELAKLDRCLADDVERFNALPGRRSGRHHPEATRLRFDPGRLPSAPASPRPPWVEPSSAGAPGDEIVTPKLIDAGGPNDRAQPQ